MKSILEKKIELLEQALIDEGIDPESIYEAHRKFLSDI
jgi:hypothetical protein